MRSKPMERFMPEDVKSWQYKAWALVESSQWEILISVLIALNTVVLMMEVCFGVFVIHIRYMSQISIL